jgi:hypothetical protein
VREYAFGLAQEKIMTVTHLPDPRRYPEAPVSNRLIQMALSVQEADGDLRREECRAALRDAVISLLEREEVLVISVALNMAPSADCHRVLWQALRAAVEQAPGRHAVLFAIPLVLVAGSRQRAALPERIADVDGLNALLRTHGVFGIGAEAFVSGKLVSPDSVIGLSPVQLFRLTRQLADAARGIPVELPPATVTVKEEGVFLRYLTGVAIQEGECAPVQFDGKVGAWGVPLMKFIGEQLKTDGVTLFPIPRAPEPLMQALVVGQHARFEIALQVFVSSALRKLRAEGKTPLVRVASHENNEIHFTISDKLAGCDEERFVWPLSPQDAVLSIEAAFRELMLSCQVDEVLVSADVQPEWSAH